MQDCDRGTVRGWCKYGGIVLALIFGLWMAVMAEAQQITPAISVTVNKSLVFSLPQKARRISVTQPEVAEVTVVAPNQLLINGKSVGVTSLLIWPESGQVINYDLVVIPDVEALRRQLKSLFPNEKVELSTSGPSLVLKGEVSNESVYDKVLDVALTYLPPQPAAAVAPPSGSQSVTITSQAVLPPTGTAFAGGGQLAFNDEAAYTDADRWPNRRNIPGIIDLLVINDYRQIELDVIVAEISLTKTRQIGIDFQYLIKNGASSTAFGTSLLGSQAGLTGNQLIQNPATFPPVVTFGPAATAITALINRNYSLAAVYRLIQNRAITEILAQPKLVIKNGRTGGFLSGGEFPLPVNTGLGTQSTATVEFKPFGVRLDFLPTITWSNQIDMRVFPEVSERDDQHAVNGIPSLTVRRTVSRVQMSEGDTLILSGLVSRNVLKSMTKVPLLGDIPILGGIFRATSFEEDEKELIFVITPRIVRTLKPGEKPQIPSLEKYDSPDMRQIPLPGTSDQSSGRAAPGGPTIP